MIVVKLWLKYLHVFKKNDYVNDNKKLKFQWLVFKCANPCELRYTKLFHILYYNIDTNGIKVL